MAPGYLRYFGGVNYLIHYASTSCSWNGDGVEERTFQNSPILGMFQGQNYCNGHIIYLKSKLSIMVHHSLHYFRTAIAAVEWYYISYTSDHRCNFASSKFWLKINLYPCKVSRWHFSSSQMFFHAEPCWKYMIQNIKRHRTQMYWLFQFLACCLCFQCWFLL